MYTPSQSIVTCHIAGFSHWGGLDAIKELGLGTVISMKGEPDNPHDPCAVALYHGSTKLGYIPQNENEQISNLIFFGHADILEAKIAQIDPTAHPEQQLRVTIRIKDVRTAQKSPSQRLAE
jgi:hypothetical protein